MNISETFSKNPFEDKDMDVLLEWALGVPSEKILQLVLTSNLTEITTDALILILTSTSSKRRAKENYCSIWNIVNSELMSRGLSSKVLDGLEPERIKWDPKDWDYIDHMSISLLGDYNHD